MSGDDSLWLTTHCRIDFQVGLPTPFIFMLRPGSDDRQWVAEDALSVEPAVPVTEYRDAFGNRCQRLVANPGPFSIDARARVRTAASAATAPGAPFVPVPDLPASLLGYLIASRYCEADRLGDRARHLVANEWPGYDQVRRINDWIRAEIAYRPGTSNVPVSALETLARGQGVCRDLAHLGVALCRALTIPARLVVGYLHGLEPMDMHAWFEAWVGGRWYAFDPTQAEPRGGRVAIAYGHDAGDVAVFTQFGPSLAPTAMTVSVQRAN